MASSYYEPQVSDALSNPVAAGELVAHLAAAFQLERARDLRMIYHEEIRPVAKRLFKERDYEHALEYYRALLVFDREDDDIHFHLALCYGRLDLWDQAEEHLATAMSLNETAWWIYVGYADLLSRKRRQLETAEKYLNQALEMAQSVRVPKWKFSAIYVTLGRIMQARKLWSRAGAYFRMAVESDQRSAFAHYELARHIWKNGGNPEEALQHLDEASRLDSSLLQLEPLRQEILSGTHFATDEDSIELPDLGAENEASDPA